eukprot:4770627-Amphidinium_carterae.1
MLVPSRGRVRQPWRQYTLLVNSRTVTINIVSFPDRSSFSHHCECIDRFLSKQHSHTHTDIVKAARHYVLEPQSAQYTESILDKVCVRDIGGHTLTEIVVTGAMEETTFAGSRSARLNVVSFGDSIHEQAALAYATQGVARCQTGGT